MLSLGGKNKPVQLHATRCSAYSPAPIPRIMGHPDRDLYTCSPKEEPAGCESQPARHSCKAGFVCAKRQCMGQATEPNGLPMVRPAEPSRIRTPYTPTTPQLLPALLAPTAARACSPAPPGESTRVQYNSLTRKHTFASMKRRQIVLQEQLCGQSSKPICGLAAKEPSRLFRGAETGLTASPIWASSTAWSPMASPEQLRGRGSQPSSPAVGRQEAGGRRLPGRLPQAGYRLPHVLDVSNVLYGAY